MQIDFTQIENSEDFELLCEDLLQAMGFAIEAKVARGPDLGKDVIALRTLPDPAGFSETHRYLVECKHYAKSNKSVREGDIGRTVARMGTHNCDRYILATSTVPSEKVRTQLANIQNTVHHYRATTWSRGDLIRFLDEHPKVRDRAYRLYAICERKGWAEHARDYNALVLSWGASQEQAQVFREQLEQRTLF